MTKKKWKYLVLYTSIACSLIPGFFAISCKTYDKNRPNWENVSNDSDSFFLDFTTDNNPSLPIINPKDKERDNSKPKNDSSKTPKKPEIENHIPPKPTTKSLTSLFGYKIINSVGNWDNYFEIERSETQPILEKMNFKKNIDVADINVNEFIELFNKIKKQLIKANNWKNYQIDYFQIFKDEEINKYFSVDMPPLDSIKRISYRSYIDIRFFFDAVPNNHNLIRLSVQINHDAKNHLDRRRRSTALLRRRRHDPTVYLTPLFTIEIPWKTN
ncbi:hypothetical protein KQ875_00910 [Mycoplasma zalophi]|uniref:Variable surface lipoprotein n=1 Tax=Mycoplasma zalophi TaxID=191287 RepID=A0ABS6DPI0_9MOLU|nr:hypothetical protein [Mycoplasma zalophi]MBU4692158.1 hypothetical protein [Mycoplasma zalophi]